jgi:hypothetical protein
MACTEGDLMMDSVVPAVQGTTKMLLLLLTTFYIKYVD